MDELRRLLSVSRLDIKHDEKSYQRLICKKETLSQVQDFLKGCNIDIRPNILLFSLYVHYYPESVDNDEYCIALSSSVNRSIAQDSVEDFSKYLILFSKAVNNFCKKDKEETVKFSIDYYNFMENAKSLIKDPQELERICSLQEKIAHNLKNIYRVDVSEHIKKMDTSSIQDKIIESIEKSMQKAYWDFFENEILNSRFDVLQKCLTEVREILIEISSSKISKEEICEFFDIDFVIMLIERGVYEPNNLKNLLVYIFSVINQVGTRITETMAIQEKCLNLINNNVDWSPQGWAKIISFCFREIYQRLKSFVKVFVN